MGEHIEPAASQLPESPLQRREPTTTHDDLHAGSPRLAVEREWHFEGERQVVFYLRGEQTTIGSDPGCDLVLPDLAAHHATVRHDERDEYVVLSAGPEVRVHGVLLAVGEPQLLRSGARVDLGEHRLAYYRDEHADHGRPYGGRVGGEAGHQRSQPPRDP